VTSGTGFETVNAILQGLKGGNKGGNLSLEFNDSLSSGGIRGNGLRPVLWREGRVRRGAEKMSIAGLARARLARENGGQGAGGLVARFVRGGAGGQAFKGGLNGGEVVEAVETVSTAAEFARGLGSAEHQKAQNGGLVAAKIEDRADPMFVLGNTGVSHRSDEVEVFKGMDGLADLFFGEIEHRVATGSLIARVKQSVEREGIVLWRGDLFFDERAENAELMGREMHSDKVATDQGPAGVTDNEEAICRRTNYYSSVKIRCGGAVL
jgi:hypothetical protein